MDGRLGRWHVPAGFLRGDPEHPGGEGGAAFQLHHNPQSPPLPGGFPAFPRALSSVSGKSPAAPRHAAPT